MHTRITCTGFTFLVIYHQLHLLFLLQAKTVVYCIAVLSKRCMIYRAEKKSWYVVARNFFLLLLNFSAWPFLGAA